MVAGCKGADLSRATGTDLRARVDTKGPHLPPRDSELGRARRGIRIVNEAVYFANDARLHASHRT